MNRRTRDPLPLVAGGTPGGVPSWDAEEFTEVRAPLDLSGLATAYTATWARREFVAWLNVDLAAGELGDNLRSPCTRPLPTAPTTPTRTPASPDTGEAGPVRLLARRSVDAIRITVSDRGTWREPTTLTTVRGRGLPVIPLLVRDVHLEVGPAGTTVHLRTPLPAPRS